MAIDNVNGPKYPVQTLEKALDIIELLAQEPGNGLGISELSRRLDMGKSTIHRILDTLTAYGYVEKVMNKSDYQLSWRLYEIGNVVPRQRNLGNLNLEMLRELNNEFQETVNLAVPVKEHVVIISKVESVSTALKANLNIGEREPMHATALGQVLLSDMTPDQIMELLGPGPLHAFTNNTITSVDSLILELSNVRERGYAIDDQEYYLGLSCIAMPVRDHNNKIVAAISVSGPSARMNFSKISQIKDKLSLVTMSFSEYLGAKEK